MQRKPILTDIKLIEKLPNIETYIANLRIIIKKFIAKDANEALLYKLKLLENKKYRKIYDVIEDQIYKNILYIYAAPEENINDLLCIKISKENVPDGHAKPIDKNEMIEMLQKEEAMCKIKANKLENNKIKYLTGSGFFLEMNINGLPFNKCLMTNNHILNAEFFTTNKEIKIEYKKEIKMIHLGQRRIYTSKRLDYTCVEIYDNDNIKQFFHINQQILVSNIDIFINEDIFILQYPEGNKFSFDKGKILSVYENNKFMHSCRL